MFLTFIHDLDTACHALPPIVHIHALKTTLTNNLSRETKASLEALGLLDNIIAIRKTLTNIPRPNDALAVQHEIYKRIQKLEQEANLTEVFYTPPVLDYEQSTEEFHQVIRDQERIMLRIPSGFQHANHSFLSPTHQRSIAIHVTTQDTQLMQVISERLYHDEPTFTKQSPLNQPTHVTFHMKNPPQKEVPHREPCIEHCCVFYGKDPAISTYLDLINTYVFQNELPQTIINILRELTGQPLLEYPTNVDLPHAWPETQPTNTFAH